MSVKQLDPALSRYIAADQGYHFFTSSNAEDVTQMTDFPTAYQLNPLEILTSAADFDSWIANAERILSKGYWISSLMLPSLAQRTPRLMQRTGGESLGMCRHGFGGDSLRISLPSQTFVIKTKRGSSLILLKIGGSSVENGSSNSNEDRMAKSSVTKADG
jgi:hypothetical protein